MPGIISAALMRLLHRIDVVWGSVMGNVCTYCLASRQANQNSLCKQPRHDVCCKEGIATTQQY
jgi:hypothetical protein